MKLTKLFLYMMFAFMVVGCQSLPERIIVQDKVTLIEVPNELLVKVTVPVPPDKKVYLASTDAQKEGLLITYIGELLKSIGEANINMDNIMKYQLKAKATLAGPTGDAK